MTTTHYKCRVGKFFFSILKQRVGAIDVVLSTLQHQILFNFIALFFPSGVKYNRQGGFIACSIFFFPDVYRRMNFFMRIYFFFVRDGGLRNYLTGSDQ